MSKDELVAAFKKMRAQRAHREHSRGDFHPAHDKVGAASHRAIKPPRHGGPGSRGIRAGALLPRLDKNKDGKLSKDEVPEGLWRRIARLDQNKDGAISKDELRRAPGKRPSGKRRAISKHVRQVQSAGKKKPHGHQEKRGRKKDKPQTPDKKRAPASKPAK